MQKPPCAKHQMKQGVGGLTGLKQWHITRLRTSPFVIGMGRRPGYVLLRRTPKFGGWERFLPLLLTNPLFSSQVYPQLSEQVASPGSVWKGLSQGPVQAHNGQ